jgi:hypothetical protein
VILLGEVQQDLFLSRLTIGQAYRLLEILQWIPDNRWRRKCSVRQHGENHSSLPAPRRAAEKAPNAEATTRGP